MESQFEKSALCHWASDSGIICIRKYGHIVCISTQQVKSYMRAVSVSVMLLPITCINMPLLWKGGNNWIFSAGISDNKVVYCHWQNDQTSKSQPWNYWYQSTMVGHWMQKKRSSLCYELVKKIWEILIKPLEDKARFVSQVNRTCHWGCQPWKRNHFS